MGKQKCFFDGITLFALEKCEVPYELPPKEGEAWKRLQAYLRKQSYTIWCSQRGWDNFLKYTIERNKEEAFFSELKEKERESPGDLYLTYDGRLKTAKSLTRWDW